MGRALIWAGSCLSGSLWFLWWPLKASGGLWGFLGASGLWGPLRASGGLWELLGAAGDVWRPLGISGLLGTLGASGGVWWPVGISGPLGTLGASGGYEGLWGPLVASCLWWPLGASGGLLPLKAFGGLWGPRGSFGGLWGFWWRLGAFGAPLSPNKAQSDPEKPAEAIRGYQRPSKATTRARKARHNPNKCQIRRNTRRAGKQNKRLPARHVFHGVVH